MRLSDSFLRFLLLVATAASSIANAEQLSSRARIVSRDAGTITMTIGTSQGVITPNCQGGQWTVELNLILATSVNGLQPMQPMQETGLPTITMSMFLNGQPATVSLGNTFNVDNPTASGNTWVFTVQDDEPNVGGSIQLGSCSGGNAPTFTASFFTNSFVTGQGVQNPPIPAVNGVPTLINNLNPANLASGGATTSTGTGSGTGGNTATPSSSPSNSPAANGAATGSIVITLGPELDQNGGNGINNLECNGGQLSTTINLQVSTNINNIHDYQPMAETGLPIISMAFFINGNPGAVSVQNTFNVASSNANGNNWIFGLADDGPHPGGQLTIGSCVVGAPLPTVTVAFSTNTFVVGQGLPNGADGGPPVPAVNGVPKLVNALPSNFIDPSQYTSSSGNAGAGSSAASVYTGFDVLLAFCLGATMVLATFFQ